MLDLVRAKFPKSVKLDRSVSTAELSISSDPDWT